MPRTRAGVEFYSVARSNRTKGIIGVTGPAIKTLTCGFDDSMIVEHNLHEDGDSTVTLHDKVFLIHKDNVTGNLSIKEKNSNKLPKAALFGRKFTPKNVIQVVISEAVKDGVCVGNRYE